jgi:DNA-directed RNA polymerase specialized sigma24 family protein
MEVSSEVFNTSREFAYRYGRMFPMVEPDDIHQEVLIAYWLSKDKVIENGWWATVSRNAALALQAKYQEDMCLVPFTTYTQETVREMLTEFFQGDPSWATSEIIQSFLDVLKPIHRDAIYDRYYHGDPVEKSKLSRAHKALTVEMNRALLGRPREGLGSRRVMSNAAARAEIDKDYTE